MKYVAGVNNCGYWLVVEKDTQKIMAQYSSPEELYKEWSGNRDVDMTFIDEYLLEKSLAEHSGPPQEENP